MKLARLIVSSLVLGSLAVAVHQQWKPQTVRRNPPPLAVGTPGGPSTSRSDLSATVQALETRLATDPGDATAAARVAEALVRQARVTSNPGLAVRAEEALTRALDAKPDHYEALRMLGTVLLSQHRFREAIDVAERAARLEPRDAWNDGVAGDAHLELGDYDRAFASFDRMMTLRPSAAGYARVSYAREISGDLDGALRLMQMALDATSAHDPESQAWHHVQLGDLQLQRGATAEAEREYDHAAYTFPKYPPAVAGLARVRTARRDFAGALALYEDLMKSAPLPELAVRIGELYERLGNRDEAERHFALAENGWRYDTPEPAELVRFLATRNRRIPEALAIAQREAATRRDIRTMDALAWAAFKAGQLDLARRASREARRTGTRDATILEHARVIDESVDRRRTASVPSAAASPGAQPGTARAS